MDTCYSHLITLHYSGQSHDADEDALSEITDLESYEAFKENVKKGGRPGSGSRPGSSKLSSVRSSILYTRKKLCKGQFPFNSFIPLSSFLKRFPPYMVLQNASLVRL